MRNISIKLLKKVLALVIVTILPIGLYIYIEDDVQLTLNINSPQKLNKYYIQAEFRPNDKEIDMFQEVIYINKTGKELDRIYFHIYPNSFKSEDTSPYFHEEMSKAYPNGFNSGFINIDDVQADNEKLDYKIIGKGQSILLVLLDEPLKENDSILIEIESMIKIPNSRGRFGYGEFTYNLGNWYPIAVVYDHEGWNLDPYYKLGDPFYNDISEYHVELTTPSEYIPATTGEIVEQKSKDGKTIYHIEASKVRDFMMILSDKFKWIEKTVDDIKVTSYYFNDKYRDEALEYAVDSISIFNELFGKYCYDEYKVVASDFFVGGMEYPNIVMIDNEIYDSPNLDTLEYIIAHETAHQWWYGMVGNDQVDEPWLDESLTEYSTILYYENKYGRDTSKKVFEIMINDQYNYLKGSIGTEQSIDKSLKEFSSWQEYTALVYNKGAIAIKELREEIGNERFFRILKDYYYEYKFKNANTKDFMEIIDKNTRSEKNNNVMEILDVDK